MKKSPAHTNLERLQVYYKKLHNDRSFTDELMQELKWLDNEAILEKISKAPSLTEMTRAIEAIGTAVDFALLPDAQKKETRLGNLNHVQRVRAAGEGALLKSQVITLGKILALYDDRQVTQNLADHEFPKVHWEGNKPPKDFRAAIHDYVITASNFVEELRRDHVQSAQPAPSTTMRKFVSPQGGIALVDIAPHKGKKTARAESFDFIGVLLDKGGRNVIGTLHSQQATLSGQASTLPIPMDEGTGFYQVVSVHPPVPLAQFQVDHQKSDIPKILSEALLQQARDPRYAKDFIPNALEGSGKGKRR